MNKIKLLTPLIVGVTSLTPLMTMSNCHSSKTAEVEVDFSKASEWKPSGSKIANKEGGYTEKEMIDKYFEMINNNPLYLAEDWAYVLLLDDLEQNAKTGTVKVSVSNIDTTNHRFTIKSTINSTVVVGGSTINTYVNQDFVNLEFGVEWTRGGSPHFDLQPAWTVEELVRASNWGYKLYVRIQTDDEEPEEETIECSDSSTEEEKREKYPVIHDCELFSYYMSDCTCHEE